MGKQLLEKFQLLESIPPIDLTLKYGSHFKSAANLSVTLMDFVSVSGW